MEEERGKKFMCVYCGHKYSTPEEMAQCILKCGEEHKKEQLKKEKETRFKEIQEINDKLSSLVKEYEKDYKEAIYWL